MCIGREIRLLKREREGGRGEGGGSDARSLIAFSSDIFNASFPFDAHHGLYTIVDEAGKIRGKLKILLVFR